MTDRNMTISEIRQANKDAGLYFFNRDTMRFFNSRIEGKALKGNYFVTSECTPNNIKRRYTLRQAQSNGSIKTIGDFAEHFDRADAIASIPK